MSGNNCFHFLGLFAYVLEKKNCARETRTLSLKSGRYSKSFNFLFKILHELLDIFENKKIHQFLKIFILLDELFHGVKSLKIVSPSKLGIFCQCAQYIVLKGGPKKKTFCVEWTLLHIWMIGFYSFSCVFKASNDDDENSIFFFLRSPVFECMTSFWGFIQNHSVVNCIQRRKILDVRFTCSSRHPKKIWLLKIF